MAGMRESMTTLLDALGVLALAAGSGVAVSADIRTGAGIVVAGIVLIGAVWLSERMSAPAAGPSLDLHVKRLWDHAGELTAIQRDRLLQMLKLGDRE